MKIAYTSDLHLDFWCPGTNEQDPGTIRSIKNYIDRILVPKAADVLVVAGDIGHYNNVDILLLKMLQRIYKDVVIVSGNHDKYLVSGKQCSKYQYNSYSRVKEFKSMCLEAGIHYLDGNVVEIGGVKFGGTELWYDISDPDVRQLWENYYNDSKLIYLSYPVSMPYTSRLAPTFDSQAHYKNELAKLKNIDQCDVFVSHVLPVKQPYESGYDPQFDVFYWCDALSNLKRMHARHVIYGHSHEARQFTYEGIEFHNSAIGYPSEQLYQEIEVFEFKQ